MTLAEHLKKLNAEKQAWIDEDPDNRWTGFYTEDLSHWTEIGVLTVRDFQRYEIESSIWEMYKEVTGIRPRHLDFKAMSDEELNKLADYLGSEMERQIQQEAEWEYESMVYAQEDAEEENIKRDEQPLPIDYVACNYQDGWL